MKKLFFAPILFLLLFSCSSNNHPRDKEVPEWSRFFKEYGVNDGSFELWDNSHDRVYYYNLERLSTRMCPASTFKILNSLIALETGVASDEDMVIPYNGVPSWNPSWNKDLTMAEAFKVSSVPYYQEIARRIGPITMQKYLDSCDYGNKNIGKEIDQFWLDGSLLISPDEQVGFIKQMYFNKLPFSDRTHRIVQKMMVQEDSLRRTHGKPYKLSYKTGTFIDTSDNYVCWMLGYIEDSTRNSHPYFFCNNFPLSKEVSLDSMQKVRLSITKKILQNRGLM